MAQHAEPMIVIPAGETKGQIGGFTVAQTTPERITALGPFQPYEIPTTGYVGEQDFAGWEVKGGAISLFYPTGFTPTSDLLSAFFYGFGIPPLILGVIDGVNTPLSQYKMTAPQAGKQDGSGNAQATASFYSDLTQKIKERTDYLTSRIDLEKAIYALEDREEKPKRQYFYRMKPTLVDGETTYTREPVYMLEEWGEFDHPDAFPTKELAEITEG